MKTMSSNLRRLFAAFLAAVLVLSLSPVPANAETDDFLVQVTDGEAAVPGAEVSFLAADTVLAKEETDAAGEARFDSEEIASADRYTVTAPGYHPLDEALTDPLSSPFGIRLEEDRVTVSGTVKTSGGEGIKDAEVTLSGARNYTAYTAEGGAFVMEDVLRLGDYSLTVTKAGFRTKTQPASLDGSNAVELEEKLAEELDFASKELTLTMGKTATNEILNLNGRQVSYRSSDESIVTVDSAGVLTPQSLGSAEITASCEEDETYLASTGSYSVRVTSGKISFEKGSEVTVTLKSVLQPMSFVNTARYAESGAVASYRVLEGEALLKDFDSTTGGFMIQKCGTIKVEVSFSDADGELLDAASYLLTVEPPFNPENVCKLEGESGVSPWYVSNVSVVRTKANSGYTFKYADDALNQELGIGQYGASELLVTMSGSPEATPDGILSDVTILVLNNRKGYAVEMTLPSIYKDSMPPEAELTVEERDTWDRFLYIISFGSRPVDLGPALMTIVASDDHSNINRIEYVFREGKEALSLDELKKIPDSEWQPYSAVIPETPGEDTTDGEEVKTTPDAFFTAYARVSDMAGNVTYLNTQGIILDTTKPTAEITDRNGDALQEGAVYSEDVELTVSANDGTDHSGLKTVEYWITGNTNDALTEGVSEETAIVLFQAEDSVIEGESGALPDDLTDSFEETITVKAKDYNSSNVVVHVKVTDRADNVFTAEATLDIELNVQGIQVIFEAEPAPLQENGSVYGAPRTARIVITERNEHFDADAATAAVQAALKAVDAKGDAVESAYTLGDSWTLGSSAEGDTHTLLVSFTKDANYSLTGLKYVGKSGAHTAEDFAFSIDRLDPSGTLRVHEQTSYNQFLYIISFGLLTDPSEVTFSVTASDETSSIAAISYYVAESNDASGTQTLMTKAQLDAIQEWTEMTLKKGDGSVETEVAQVSENQWQVLYVKIVDGAGHCMYVNSSGMILDTEKPFASITDGEGKELEEKIYTEDVELTISANDGERRSGLKSVVYWISGCTNDALTEGISEDSAIVLFEAQDSESGGESGPLPEDLTDSFETKITVKAEDFNRSDVAVHVKVTDRAENIFVTEAPLNFDLSPARVQIDFGDTAETYREDEIPFFTGERVILVSIWEQAENFDAEAAKDGILVDARDRNGGQVSDCFEIGDFTELGTDEATNETQYQAELRFPGDAFYTLTVSYTDALGRTAELEKTGAVTDDCFAVATGLPSGTIGFDENTTWNQLTTILSFGLWRNTSTGLVGSFNSFVGTIGSYEFYLSDSKEILDPASIAEEDWIEADIEGVSMGETFTLKQKKAEGESEVVEVKPDQVLTAYARITDLAGHQLFISTNGLILDGTKPSNGNFEFLTHTWQGYYQTDVRIRFHVEDEEVNAARSGIKTIEYWVQVKEKEAGTYHITKQAVLYSFEVDNPNYDQLISSTDQLSDREKTIVVSAEENNFEYVQVVVRVTDNAGNTAEFETEPFAILKLEPTISVTFDPLLSNGFSQESVSATITITAGNQYFNDYNPEDYISIKAENIHGERVENSYSAEEASISPREGSEKTSVFRQVIHFNEARYSLRIACPWLSWNNNQPLPFTVDLTDPSGTVTAEKDLGTWDELISMLTFGLFSKEGVTVYTTVKEETSPLTVEYLVHDGETALTREQLSAMDGWIAVKNAREGEQLKLCSLSEDQRATVYVRAIDGSGRSSYYSTNGIIVDKTQPSESEGGVFSFAQKPNEHNFLHESTDVEIHVQDEEVNGSRSGIKQIEYWVESADQESGPYTVTQPGGILYSFDQADPLYSDLLGSTDQLESLPVFSISAAENNRDFVRAAVKVTDNAGNERIFYSEVFGINCTKPQVELYFEDNQISGCFQGERTAVITVTDRSSCFDFEAFKDGISVEATDVHGAPVEGSYQIIDGGEIAGDNPNETKHVVKVQFSEANYSFSVSYQNKADMGVSMEEIVFTQLTEGEDGEPTRVEVPVQFPISFTVDLTNPVGTVTAEKELGTWNELISTLTFGLFSRETVVVKTTVTEKTSPLTIEYLVDTGTEALSESTLSGMTGWTAVSGAQEETEYTLCTMDPNQRFTVYVRAMDASGRSHYYSTDGIIADNQSSSGSIYLTPSPNGNGFYNSDVSAEIRATDEVSGKDARSGIKEIQYSVDSGLSDSPSQGGVLFSFGVENPTFDQLIGSTNELQAGQHSFVISASANNSNGVIASATVIDNAGNSASFSVGLKIDVTKPTIELRTPTGFLSTDQSITILITERNFDPNRVTITATKNGEPFEVRPTWTTQAGTSPNGDDTLHTGTFVFTEDGNYAITEITCIDLADNIQTERYDRTFTIDKTAPVITITYDNNDVTNEKYYKDKRVATITVVETNFDSAAVDIVATDDGAAVQAPTLSEWTHEGDKHTATVEFSRDAHYTFSFHCQDKAGNTAEQTEPDFYVDTIPPKVEIKGVADQSANNDEGDIGFVLTATDTNFDVFEPKVVAIVVRDGEIVKELYKKGVVTEIRNGKVYTIVNLEEDGIYELSCTVVDKAGNAFSEVTYIDKDGKPVADAKSAQDDLLRFSVNRNGSTYDLDENTFDLTGKYYVQNVLEDVVIIEVNADELTEYHVTVNGKELKEGQDYTLTREGGGDTWMRYIYSVNKDLFAEEGEYVVVVSSKDKATNNAFSDVKNAGVHFVVDRTAPVVSVSGMENGGRYQTDRQTVTIIPTDDGGALASLKVILVDAKGNELETLIDLSGQDLMDALEENGGIFTIELGEGLYQNVRIICKDCAVDEKGDVNTYDETFRDISVSSSAFKIYWANRPLRYSALFGILGAGTLFWFLLAKRRKKDEEQENS